MTRNCKLTNLLGLHSATVPSQPDPTLDHLASTVQSKFIYYNSFITNMHKQTRQQMWLKSDKTEHIHMID